LSPLLFLGKTLLTRADHLAALGGPRLLFLCFFFITKQYPTFRVFPFSCFRGGLSSVAFPRKIPFDKPFPGYYKEKFQPGPLAQSVEQRTFNPLVVSSILARPTSKKI
jgi:hypothetical protein